MYAFCLSKRKVCCGLFHDNFVVFRKKPGTLLSGHPFIMRVIDSLIESLWQQFKQGESVVFRYTTEADEPRQARFQLKEKREQIKALIQQ